MKLIISNKIYNFDQYETVYAWKSRNKMLDYNLFYGKTILQNESLFIEYGIVNNTVIQAVIAEKGASKQVSWWESTFLPVLLMIGMCTGLFTLLTLLTTAPISLTPIILLGNKPSPFWIRVAQIFSLIIQLTMVGLVIYTSMFYISKGFLMWGLENKCSKKYKKGQTMGFIDYGNRIAGRAFLLFGVVYFLIFGIIGLTSLISTNIEYGAEFAVSGFGLIIGNLFAPGFFNIGEKFISSVNEILNEIHQVNEKIPKCDSPDFWKTLQTKIGEFKTVFDKFTNKNINTRATWEEVLQNPTTYFGNSNNTIGKKIGEEIHKFRKSNTTGPLLSFFKYIISDKKVSNAKTMVDNLFEKMLWFIENREREALKKNQNSKTKWEQYTKERMPLAISLLKPSDLIIYLLEFLIGTYCTTGSTVNTIDKYTRYNVLSIPKMISEMMISMVLLILVSIIIIIYAIIVNVSNFG
jgi:hypothetical protein